MTVYVVMARAKPCHNPQGDLCYPEEHVLCVAATRSLAEGRISFQRECGFAGQLRIDEYEVIEKEK